MVKKIIFITGVSLILAFAGCKKDDHSGHDHSKHGQMGNTKIVMVGDMQVVLDLQDKAGHDKMMKMMDAKMMGMDKDSNKFLLLTLVDKPNMKVIKGANVNIIVTSPDGKSVSKKTHIMDGKGMYHYSAGFSMKASGDYKVKVDIKIDGKASTAETSFKI